jgi:chromosomal replication initiation ATPase DnaA
VSSRSFFNVLFLSHAVWDNEHGNKTRKNPMFQERKTDMNSEIKNGLNANYTFENFRQTESNKTILGASLLSQMTSEACITPSLSMVALDLGKLI